jgi:probable phosphoglycerate mutase
MAETELILIRHAQSELNAAHRWQGRSDSPLSSLGRKQAVELARELQALPLDAIVASPLVRCVATAEPLAAQRGLAIELAPALSELDVGEWGGRTREEIARAWPEQLLRFDAEEPDARAPGGESRREVGRRVGAAVAALEQRYARSRIAVVTHLGVILALVPGLRLANARHHRVAARDLDLTGLRDHGIAVGARSTARTG